MPIATGGIFVSARTLECSNTWASALLLLCWGGPVPARRSAPLCPPTLAGCATPAKIARVIFDGNKNFRTT